MGKTIFMDIDGTLRDHTAGVPESAYAALRSAVSDGHSFVICTGRTVGTIPDDIDLSLFDGIIAGGGCYIEHNGDIIRDEYIPDEIVCAVKELFSQNGIPYSLEAKNRVYMSEAMAENIAKLYAERKRLGAVESETARMAENAEKIHAKENMGEYLAHKVPVSKISFIFTADQYHDFCKTVDKRLMLICYSPDSDGLLHCELISSGCDKGSGVRCYCSRFGITPEETIGIGDSMNDAQLFAAVGTSVCMGNADSEVKQLADIVFEPLLEDGLAKGLKQMGLI